MWLEQALAARGGGAGRPDDFYDGKRAAARYFFRYELPKVEAWLGVVASREPVCRQMRDAWF